MIIILSKNDQLQARIMHLEFELREKNDELAKVKFDQHTNSINELKKANEVSIGSFNKRIKH